MGWVLLERFLTSTYAVPPRLRDSLAARSRACAFEGSRP